MVHLDLFSGIGGFAYAVDQVFENVEHIFCDNDKFCQKVLQKHWPNSLIYEDIRTITNTNGTGSRTPSDNVDQDWQTTSKKRQQSQFELSGHVDLLTGGFPCQPFSQAGKRGGTTDNRYLWPEMLRVIQLTKPTWVIAENVRGLLTINEGMVFEQVCLDLEGEGYEVQPLIIPAVAINAPHRRDRIWFIAHRTESGRQGDGVQGTGRLRFGSRNGENKEQDNNAQDSVSKRSRGGLESNGQVLGGQSTETKNEGSSWEKDWVEVAQRLCRLDDGLPTRLGGLRPEDIKQYPYWRQQALKAYGNSIVPQVAIEILKAIKNAAKLTNQT